MISSQSFCDSGIFSMSFMNFNFNFFTLFHAEYWKFWLRPLQLFGPILCINLKIVGHFLCHDTFHQSWHERQRRNRHIFVSGGEKLKPLVKSFTLGWLMSNWCWWKYYNVHIVIDLTFSIHFVYSLLFTLV